MKRFSVFIVMLVLAMVLIGCGGSGGSIEKVGLTIAKSGQGTITPLEGTYEYDRNSVVNLTATPDAGWTFDRWDGVNGSEVSANSLTMNGDKSIIAVFNRNLLVDPGFESDGSWTYNPFYAERDTTSPHTGTYCLKYTIGSAHGEQFIEGGFTPGDTIKVRFWGYITGGTSASFLRLGIQFYNGAASAGTAQIDSPVQPSSYTKCEQNITIPANTTRIRIYITGSGGGTAYVDDMFVGYEE